MDDSSRGSVSQWLLQLQAGDDAAAQKLWERYFERLVGLARVRLTAAARRMTDQEDVALSAFDSFCRGAAQGRFPALGDRNDLWRLLVIITGRKVCDAAEREQRQKRGGGKAIWRDSELEAERGGLDELIGCEPTPEFAAQVAEECGRLLAALGDPLLRAIAIAKMEGYSNEEIAARQGCVTRTIERKLGVIRSLWAKELSP